jgi:hypothetical protein
MRHISSAFSYRLTSHRQKYDILVLPALSFCSVDRMLNKYTHSQTVGKFASEWFRIDGSRHDFNLAGNLCEIHTRKNNSKYATNVRTRWAVGREVTHVRVGYHGNAGILVEIYVAYTFPVEAISFVLVRTGLLPQIVKLYALLGRFRLHLQFEKGLMIDEVTNYKSYRDAKVREVRALFKELTCWAIRVKFLSNFMIDCWNSSISSGFQASLSGYSYVNNGWSVATCNLGCINFNTASCKYDLLCSSERDSVSR